MFERFAQAIRDGVTYFHRGKPFHTVITIHSPASEADIASVGISLPDEYRMFLARWNGATLFTRQGLEVELPILRMQDAVELTQRLARIACENDLPWPDNLLIIAEVPAVGGDYIALDAEGRVLDANHDLRADEWLNRIIADDFAKWLDRTVQEPYYWL